MLTALLLTTALAAANEAAPPAHTTTSSAAPAVASTTAAPAPAQTAAASPAPAATSIAAAAPAAPAPAPAVVAPTPVAAATPTATPTPVAAPGPAAPVAEQVPAKSAKSALYEGFSEEVASATAPVNSNEATGGFVKEGTPELAPPRSGNIAMLWAPVVLLAAAAALILKGKRQGKSGRLKVVDALHLGKNRSLLVVDVRGREVLVATTDAGISLLDMKVPSLGAADTASAAHDAPDTDDTDDGVRVELSHRRARTPRIAVTERAEPSAGLSTLPAAGVQEEAAFERFLGKTANARCVEDEELTRKIARLQDALQPTDGNGSSNGASNANRARVAGKR